jgi:hypothetical protein
MTEGGRFKMLKVGIAPLNAARTSRRDVPTNSGEIPAKNRLRSLFFRKTPELAHSQGFSMPESIVNNFLINNENSC